MDASLDAIRERLRHYSLFEVCSAVGRVSAVLHNAKGDREAQFQIAAGLLGENRMLNLARRLEFFGQREVGRGEGSANYVLFGRPTLNALLQLAFIELPADGEATGAGLDALGEALLMLGEIIDRTPRNPADTSFATADGRRKWAYYAATELMVPGSEAAVHLVVRAADLFLTDDEELKPHPDYIDLPALLVEATGLPPEAHLLSLLLFNGPMYGVTAEKAAQRDVVIDAATFRGSHLQFSESQIESFLRLGGKRAAEVADDARKFYSADRLRPAFLLPFERSPLVRFGDRAVCVSLPLLERRMTAGLYHILFNSRPQGDPFRNRFMRFIGHRWARYVERTFARIAMAECDNARVAGLKPIGKRRGVSLPASFVPESDLRAALDRHFEAAGARPGRGETQLLCDGALIVGDTAVFIEVKAKMFALASRAGEDEAQFYERLDEITVDAAGQLEATIRHFAAGAFRNVGLDPTVVKHVIPLVVSLQELMMTPVLRNVIEERIRAKGHFITARPDGPDVEAFRVFDPGDLDWLELLVEQSRLTVPEILRQWDRDDVGRGASFASWSAATGFPGGLASTHCRYHDIRWEELTSAAREYFRAHRVDGVSDHGQA